MRRREAHSQVKRYKMRQKLVALGDDFYIEDEQGRRVFKVDGKVMRIRDTLAFEDMNGQVLCRIKEKLVHIKDTMTIEGPEGETVATVKKDLINVLRDHFDVKIKDAPDLDVTGNIIDHDYRIKQGRHEVARVDKKFFRMRDTYGVEIQPSQNDVLILAVTVALDMMAHKGN
jgi:uncharacterized protein YxjI